MSEEVPSPLLRAGQNFGKPALPIQRKNKFASRPNFNRLKFGRSATDDAKKLGKRAGCIRNRTKNPAAVEVAGYDDDAWRRRRDSNPRYPFEVYTLSRRAPSTARTLLQYSENNAFVRSVEQRLQKRDNVTKKNRNKKIITSFRPGSRRSFFPGSTPGCGSGPAGTSFW